MGWDTATRCRVPTWFGFVLHVLGVLVALRCVGRSSSLLVQKPTPKIYLLATLYLNANELHSSNPFESFFRFLACAFVKESYDYETKVAGTIKCWGFDSLEGFQFHRPRKCRKLADVRVTL